MPLTIATKKRKADRITWASVAEAAVVVAKDEAAEEVGVVAITEVRRAAALTITKTQQQRSMEVNSSET